MPKYAVSHPGKIGDALFALPTMRKLYKDTGLKSDFYTSNYCLPLKKLFEYQSCVDQVIVPEEYVIHDMGCGVQPWEMPINATQYEKVYHLGFRNGPIGLLHIFEAQQVGIVGVENPVYEYPDLPPPIEGPYIVIASRGITTYEHVYKYLFEHSPIPVIQVGHAGETLSGNSINLCGIDLLETCNVIAKSTSFVSIPSSNFVLATSFPHILKIGMHDGVHWNPTHFVQDKNTWFPILPSPEDVLKKILNFIENRE
jgi:hypothetical protein